MTPDRLTARVDTVRAFNRFYTKVIGTLDEHLVDSAYSLTEARVLWELAHHDEREVAALRRDLGLDAGYLSRILTRFASDGLISRHRDAKDARRQILRLTDTGRSAFADLDARSAAQVHGLLTQLPDERQSRLIDAMRTIREVLEETEQRALVTIRAPRPGDFGWVVSRNAALYAQEYGWGRSYEALVAKIIADYLDDTDQDREAAWIAEVGGEPVGCVFCVRKDDETAQLRLLLVEPSARGLGIGSKLVDECLDFARRAGYRRMILWTNSVLVSARRIYEGAGFKLVDEEEHRSFGHDLVGQFWEREL